MHFSDVRQRSYLKANSISGSPPELGGWQQRMTEKYREEWYEQLRSSSSAEWCSGTPDLRSLKSRHYQLIFDFVVALDEIDVRLDALMLARSGSAKLECPYIPVRFVPAERLSTNDKLLLAFDAFAFSQAYGKMPRAGRIIHGGNHAVVNLPLSVLLRKVQKVLRAIKDQQMNAAPPPLALNKHCAECEFQTRCRQEAVQKDDLSLLTTLSANERRRQNEKGIFTVLQFSYTFRPSRRSVHALPKHQPALKALAIRKSQIHILGTPTFTLPQTPVYIDVEGDPDRDFYYLIGFRIASENQPLRYSFWANTEDDEREIWANCVQALRRTHQPAPDSLWSLRNPVFETDEIKIPGGGKRLAA